MFRLAYNLGGETRWFLLDRDRVTLGRMAECDLSLSDHTVSRQHAELTRTEEGWSIRDLGARNGVSVNGERIQAARLSSGDVINLGLFQLIFEEELSQKVQMRVPQSGAPLPEGTIVRSLDEVKKMLSAAQEAPAPKANSEAEVGRLARTSRILAVLAEVSSTLLSAESLDQVLQKILEVTFQHLPVQRGVVLLASPEGELLPRAIKQAGKGEEAIQISQTIARKAFEERVAILTQDAQLDDRFQAGMSIRMLGIRSALCVPLSVEGRVIGLLYVDTPLKVKAYGEFELDLLTALAGYAAVAIRQTELRTRLQEEKLAKSRLERYHSPSVVERILAGGESGATMEVRDLEVSILFVDIVGFSTLSEDMPPREVATLLNAYFSRMADVVFEHDGTLDKFIGDAIMAVFGAPISSADHALRAVRCAVGMKAALAEFNAENAGLPKLDFRIGINSGRVVAGDIGSHRRREYSVLGNTVNLASRLQSEVAKPGSIAVGEATAEACGSAFDFERISQVKVKGIKKPVTAYEVKG